MKALYILIFFCLFSATQVVYAQETLTLEEAIDMALTNNQEIAIQRKHSDIFRNNVY